MKLSDIPPHESCNLLWGILDRYHSAKDRQPFGKSVKTEVHLTIDDARMFWAAAQWLKRYADWSEEAVRSGGTIGVWPAKTSLGEAAKWLSEKAATISKDERVVVLSPKEMRTLNDCSLHLDHYSLMTSVKEKPKGSWKRK